MKKILLLVGLVSSFAYGQDYYSPTDKDKEPLARFPITVKVVGKSLVYSLPKELTGFDSTELTLDQQSDEDGVRVYSSPQAVATCMGKEGTPGCVVKHKNLAINKTAAKDFIDEKYLDPQLRSAAHDISEKFQLESGNEPIGFIGSLITREEQKIDLNKKLLGTSYKSNYYNSNNPSFIVNPAIKLNSEYVDKGKQIVGGTYEAKFQAIIKENNEKKVVDVVIKGNLSGVRHGTHIAGTWTATQGAQGNGWFDFTFDSSFTSFKGYFGHKEADGTNKRDGLWEGTRQ